MDDYVSKPYRSAEVFECMARHLGCRYQARETAPQAEAQTAGELSAEDISSLPVELRHELREAIVTLNQKRIAAAIGRISEINEGLGLILTRHAGAYGYSRIFDVIKT